MKFILFSVLLMLLLHRSLCINCVAPGSFREARDPTCKKYYTCRLILSMYYVKEDYECGFLQRFNPTTQQCDYNSICIDSFCDNQRPLATLPDPNAINPVCRQTFIQCVGITNQYPTIEPCLNQCC